MYNVTNTTWPYFVTTVYMTLFVNLVTYVCVKMATLLGSKLYVKTFSMLYVDCNGQVVFIINKKGHVHCDFCFATTMQKL